MNTKKKVSVAGGGTQGSQIASQIAYKGFPVTVWVRSEESIARAKPRFESIKKQYLQELENIKNGSGPICRGLSDQETLSEEEVDALIANAIRNLEAIEFTTDKEKAFGGADYVIECIAEVPEEKNSFYTSIAPVLKDDAIVLTDSSTLLPSSFMEATGRPESFMSMHFGNQIWKNNFAELMRTPKTSEETVAAVENFAKEIGMVPLKLNKEQPGYLINSMLIPWLSAAAALWGDDVSDPETIDLTWALDTGADMGQTPFHKMDKIGLPLCAHIMSMNPEAQKEGTPLNKAVHKMKAMIAQGKTGISAGEGFFKYSDYDR